MSIRGVEKNRHQPIIGKPSGLYPFPGHGFSGSIERGDRDMSMEITAGLLAAFAATVAAQAAVGQRIEPESLPNIAAVGVQERPPLDWRAEANAIVESSWAADGPGLAIVITRNGEIIYGATRGMADLEDREPVTLDTVFRIGSMTKQFTAALVLMLAEEGKLSLDDPVAKFVPGYPAPGGRATIRQLLNHTSGIQSYNEIPGWLAEPNTSRAFTTAELIGVFRDLAVRFEPGSDWAYSNSGYVLLAGVIEAITERPWHEALKERITGPLGLSSIHYGDDANDIPEHAMPYSAARDGVGPAPTIHPSVFSAAGALVGSPRDLARWSAALHHGKVINARSYAQMITPATLPDGPPIPYGFGFFRDETGGTGSRTIPYGYGFFRETISGIDAIVHGGSAPGGATMGVYIPAQDIFIAAFSNNDAPAIHPATIARRLAALAAGRPYPLLAEVAMNTEALEPLFGVYAMADSSAEMQLYMGGGKVRLLADGREWPVYFAGEDRFMFDPDYLDWLQVTRSPSGAHAIEIHDAAAGKVHRGVRSGPLPPRVVPRATLERYVGRYELGGTVTTIGIGAGDTLTVQLAGQPTAANLRTVSATQFAANAVGALLTFEGDGPKASRLRSRLGEVEVVGSRLPDDTEPHGSGRSGSAGTSTGQASAEVDDAAGQDSIVVIGRAQPPTRSEVFEQARLLSRVDRSQLYEEALARFEMPLCPGVSGLRTDAAEMMVDRIRANADRLGLKLAGPNCTPNLIVAFVENGRRLMSNLAETHRNRFCTLPASEQAELLAEDAPVRVWTDIRVVGPTAHVWRCRWHVPSRSGGPGQMLLPSRRDIVSSLVVFDRDSVAGMMLVQLADYATMRGLSHTRAARGDEPMPTILALFADGAPRPSELTDFDVGYLRSLYWWVPNVSAASKLLAVRRRVVEEQR